MITRQQQQLVNADGGGLAHTADHSATNRFRRLLPFLVRVGLVCFLSWPHICPGKDPAVTTATEDPLVPKTRALARAGKLLDVAEFNALLKSPQPALLALPRAATERLRGREIADRAAQAYVRIGWVYHCSKCDGWHDNLAGGYAIARNAVVTAFHVLQPPTTIKQGEAYPVVVRDHDEIVPIVTVLAADETGDMVILRVAARDLHPLALAPDPRVGDAAYCFSDPHGVHGYFSSGIINRFYTRRGGSADNASDQRLNVSTDWAPGSSGAAVLDEFGNCLGHVTRITSLYNEKAAVTNDHHAAVAPVVMVLHEAIPAKAVLRLVEKLNADAAGR